MNKLKTEQEINRLVEAESQAIKTIFISYNHKDLFFVEQLKKDLEQAGIQLIIDIESMKFGDDILDFIERSIGTSDITVSVLSEHSLASPWVMLETLETFQQKDYMKAMRYIPVIIDHQYEAPDFALKMIERIENTIDLIVEEITRLSKKYVATDALYARQKRLIILRSNIDQVLLQLDQRLVADFSTKQKYEKNFSRLVNSIKQV